MMLKLFFFKNPNHKNRQGFTLIELVICCLIITIIAAIAVPSYLRVRLNMEEQKAIVTLQNIYKAQKQFWFENTNLVNGVSVPANTYASSMQELYQGVGNNQTLWGSGTYENPLDANNRDGDWEYTIGNGDATTFTASAEHLSLTQATEDFGLQIDQDGSISEWGAWPVF